ncbi:uncharacterized protein LOC109863303, partial [Pseudomyrmex gracilis]|uniref:uncharacterized protein LOC109863303 n=1 Tax=Pseudomyrmex gracilis TaxID=219809 RepID=UPI00099566B2
MVENVDFVICLLALLSLNVEVQKTLKKPKSSQDGDSSKIFKHKKYRECIRKLDLVNDTLVELGISKEYDKERTMIKWSLISWFIIVCLTNTFDGLLFLTQNNMKVSDLIIPWILQYSVHINTLHDLTIMYMLRYIGNRLDKINDHIVQLSENENCGLRCMWKKSLTVSRRYGRNTEYRKHVLWTAMHLHFELCWIARNINFFYGVQMTVQMASYFVGFLTLLYFQYRSLLCLFHVYESNKTIWMLALSTDMWTIFFLVKFVSLNHICESVCYKAEKTRTVIHRLTNLLYFANMHDMIYQFGLQILLHPLKFSGMGLFYYSYKFIRS